MTTPSARVDRIVALVHDLSVEELSELAARLEALGSGSDADSRLAAAIRRVVRDHSCVLAKLADR
jgi:hypothetical protein